METTHTFGILILLLHRDFRGRGCGEATKSRPRSFS